MSPPRDPPCAAAAQHSDEPCRRCQYPVQPIVGVEINVDGYPAAFLARDAEGYCNVAALATLARVGAWAAWGEKTQGKRRGRPKVTWDQIAAHSQNVHALTGPASGLLASLLRAGKRDEAE